MEPALNSMRVSSTDKETVGSYKVNFYSNKQALHKGLKMGLITLLVAIVSIILPGIHFVSVPLGILASPFVGIYFYRHSKVAPKGMTADFVCPICQGSNQVTAPSIAANYVSTCKKCQAELQLTPLESAPHN